MKTSSRICLNLLLLIVILSIKTAASAQLKAGFSASPTSGCPPLLVNFKDSSTGGPAWWQWDLGNGTVSYNQNPTTTYFASGNYTIKLIVKNSDGADSVTRTKYISVNAIPVADFKASATTGCFPLDVGFTDKSLAGSGTIAAWKWDFGDGALSNDQNPVHTYTNTGSYTVVLRVIKQ